MDEKGAETETSLYSCLCTSHNQRAAMETSRPDQHSCVCTSRHWCELATNHSWIRDSLLSVSSLKLLKTFLFFCCSVNKSLKEKVQIHFK